jgi:hypothetical protein
MTKLLLLIGLCFFKKFYLTNKNIYYHLFIFFISNCYLIDYGYLINFLVTTITFYF